MARSWWEDLCLRVSAMRYADEYQTPMINIAPLSFYGEIQALFPFAVDTCLEPCGVLGKNKRPGSREESSARLKAPTA